MLKNSLIIVLGLLCLFFKAEAQVNKPIDVTAKGIQIGQRVPDITINNIHNYKSTTAKISDFKGKLLILDFWATWCSPCVAMIPKMDSLQKQFGDKVQFLSVTYQSEKEVMPFLSKLEQQHKKHYNLPIITDSKELHTLFPHISLPHYVWVGADGKVKAITESKEVTKDNISKMLSGNTEMVKKSDFKIAYDSSKPFLINGNGGDGSNLLYHSVLTPYTEGISGGYNFTKVSNISPRKITATNYTMLKLFRLAYGADEIYFGWNRLILEVKDTTNLRSKATGNSYLKFLNNNAYCYELIVPPYQSTNAFKIMREDLLKFFPKYTVAREKRFTKCLVLKSKIKNNNFHSIGGTVINQFNGMSCNIQNSTFEIFTTRLEVLYLQNSPYPIVNGTGYNGRIDLLLDADLSKVTDINQALLKYNLEFVVQDWEAEVLVIKDNKFYSNKIDG
jgi:thiol-disulfide isomerase/thioredoxin